MTEGPDRATPTGGLWSGPRRSLTIGLVLTITLVASESLAVSTILPIISKDLNGVELYGWVFSAFFLGSLLGIATVGGLIDRTGLVKPFLAGLTLFGLGLLIGGLAPTMPVLVAGRFLQGMGGGAIPPTAYIAIGRSLPERLRAQMFALFAMAWVLPGVVGPVLSATVAGVLGWRWVLIGLIPIVALAAVLTLPPLRRVPDAQAADTSADNRTSADDRTGAGDRTSADDRTGAGGPPLDVDGAALGRRLRLAIMLAGGAAILLAGVTNPSIALFVLLVAIGLGLGLPAYRWLCPPGTLRLSPGLPSAVLLRGVLNFAFFSADVYLPLALQSWRGQSAAFTGVALTIATLSWSGAAWVQSRLIERFGPARFAQAGFLVVAAGTAGAATVLLPDMPIVIPLIAWAVASSGMGLGYSALSLIVLRDAPPGQEGVPTSGLQLSDVLGTSLGTGIAGALVAAGERAGAPGWVGLAGALGLAVVVGVLGLLASPRLWRGARLATQGLSVAAPTSE